MKLLMLRSNPRKNGYTQRLTDLFIKGSREAGADITDINLCDKDLKHCLGCYCCWIQTPGTCVLKDDIEGLFQQFLDADTIVFSSPLNAYSVNSHLKVFLDRTLALAQPGFVITSRGHMGNLLRYPERWPKKMAAIVVGAFKGNDIFSSIRSNFELYGNAMSIDLCGILVRPESYLLQFTFAKPKTVKLVETAFIKAGYELVSRGAISDAIIDQAALPLSSDLVHFQHYSNIYWEHAVAMEKNANDLEGLQQRVTRDVRILMREMARSIDPLATAKLKAVFQFDFPDKGLYYRLTVNKGSCSLTEEKTGSPDLRVRCSSEIWANVFMRQINVRDALANHQIELEGDKSLFSRLDRYFPPPVV
ncbi:MAG: NAD(P)H-dependent oxidoreductase [Chitinivibrionales bacterium]